LRSRFVLMLAAAAVLAAGGVAPSVAQTAAPDSPRPAANTVPMHPSTLTAGPGRPAPRRTHPHRNHVRATFNQPTPIQGTMAGPRQ